MRTVGEIIGGREIYSVEAGSTVQEVVDYLCEKGIGAIAVMEGDKVAGVFSERDLLRRVVHRKLDPTVTPVDDVMTRDIFYVRADDNRAVARNTMVEKNLRHLVVFDAEGRFLGFISMRELLEVDLEESKNLIRQLNDDYYQRNWRPKKI